MKNNEKAEEMLRVMGNENIPFQFFLDQIKKGERWEHGWDCYAMLEECSKALCMISESNLAFKRLKKFHGLLTMLYYKRGHFFLLNYYELS